MLCSTCSKTIADSAVYCPHCGQHVAGAQECTDYEYDAFISYRHLPHDSKVAVRLQRFLEGFKIPGRLSNSLGRKRLGKLFRDEDELPIASSLPDQIEHALIHSRYLVVVAGKETNKSPWVAREIELFASYHGRERIRIALAEGEPYESFPTLLRSRLEIAPDGTVDEVPQEPLAADLRGKSRKRFASESLRIAASLIGCGYDDLVQRMRARRLRAVAAGASGIAAASIAFAGFSIYQQHQIEENFRQAQVRESEVLAAEANTLFGNGERMQAIQVAMAALPQDSTSGDRPYVPAAQLALERALEVYPSNEVWQSRYAVPMASGSLIARREDRIAILKPDQTVEVRDLRTGRMTCSFDSHAPDEDQSGLDAAFFGFAGSDVILVATEETCKGFSALDGRLLWETFIEGNRCRGSFCNSVEAGLFAFVIENDVDEEEDASDTAAIYSLRIVDTGNGAEIIAADLPLFEQAEYSTGTRVAIADDGGTAVACISDVDADGDPIIHAFLVDLEDRSVTREVEIPGFIDSVTILNDLVCFVTQREGIYDEDSLTVALCDRNLKTLWSYDGTCKWKYDFESRSFFRGSVWPVALCSPPDSSGVQAVVVYNDRLMLFDSETGRITYEYTVDSVIDSCYAKTLDSGTVRIFGCTEEGEVFARFPFEADDSYGYYFAASVGKTAESEFCALDDEIFLISTVQDPEEVKCYQYSIPLETYDAIASWEYPSIFEKPSLTLCSEKNTFLMSTEEFIECVDAQTLETRWQISISDLDLIMSDREFSIVPLGDGTFCVVGEGEYNPVVYRFRENDAFLVDGYPVAIDSTIDLFSLNQVHGAAPTVFASSSGYAVRYVDLTTGETLVDYDAEDSPHSEWFTADTTITVERTAWDSESFSAHLYQNQSGVHVPSDLDLYSPAYKYDQRCGAMNRMGTRFAMACLDGSIRLFDARTGSLLWESPKLPGTASFVAISDEADTVLVQDNSGICMLLSGADGHMLRTSSMALPVIGRVEPLGEGGLVIAYSETTGQEATLMSLSDDSFGPISSIEGCVLLSPDLSWAVIDQELEGSLSVIPVFSLDDLLDIAANAIVGHELSDAERLLYHIG